MTKAKGKRRGGLLYHDIARKLISDIRGGQMQLGEKFASEKELCRRFGASHLTIRRALTLLVEQRHAVRKQGAGTFVAERPTGRGELAADDLYAVVLTDIVLSFLASIVRTIEQRAHALGKSILLCNTGADFHREAGDLERHVGRGLKRFIVTPMGQDPLYYDNLRAEHKLRIVFLDLSPPGSTIPTVKTDDVRGAEKVTEYLLRMGHKDILHISGPARFSSARERLKGYRRAMGRREKLVVEGGYTVEGGYNAVCQLMQERNKPPSAVFAANDLSAAGAIDALHDLGCKVPDDVSVFGYGDLDLIGKLYDLSTVRQDCQRMGQLCVEVLETSFYELPRLRKRLLLEPELIIRRTA